MQEETEEDKDNEEVPTERIRVQDDAVEEDMLEDQMETPAKVENDDDEAMEEASEASTVGSVCTPLPLPSQASVEAGRGRLAGVGCRVASAPGAARATAARRRRSRKWILPTPDLYSSSASLPSSSRGGLTFDEGVGWRSCTSPPGLNA